MRSQFQLGLAMVLASSACSPPANQTPESTRPKSSRSGWAEVKAPSSAALLEAPARVVAIVPAVAEVTVLHRARLVRFFVAPGDRVKAGQVVAEVEVPELMQALASFDALRLQATALGARVEALQKLKAEGLARADQVFDLERQLGEVAIAQNLAEAVMNTYGISPASAARARKVGTASLSSPSDGVVTKLYGRVGAVVEPGGEPLAVIEDARPARIEASLASELPELGRVSFIGSDGHPRSLEVAPVAHLVDGASGRTTVWFRPEGEPALPSGLIGRISITPPTDLVEVPSSAIRMDPEGPRVLRLEGEAVKAVPVSISSNSGTSALVRGALSIGDRVARNADAPEVTPPR